MRGWIRERSRPAQRDATTLQRWESGSGPSAALRRSSTEELCRRKRP
jgi:hypothetical protein